MNMLYGLESLAYERVDEMRRQAERARFLRTLPRNQGIARRTAQSLLRLLRSNAPAPNGPGFSPAAPPTPSKVCTEA